MQSQIEVNIPVNHAYKVIIKNNIWDDFLSHCADSYSPGRIFIAIDANVYRLHGEEIKTQCNRYFTECCILQIPAGEKSKSIRQWNNILNEMLKKGVERSEPLLAVGGGVTGDLAGFVAASALRGTPLIHMPTSLLAMVDSSIGGKTGINHPAGKNLIGSFYQPDAVFTDISFLETLPEREWINGLSEMLKYAAIQNPELFDRLEETVTNDGFIPTRQWKDLIYQCAKIKCDIVQDDVHEAGSRAFLNFGHTFGHALEKYAGYGGISHGEAVFVGMLAATHLSENCGGSIKKARFAPFKPFYKIKLPELNDIETLIKAMYSDKKIVDGIIRLILLREWGEPFIQKCEDDALLREGWRAAFDEFNRK